MRLFSEMASLYLNKQEVEGTLSKSEMKQLHDLIIESLLPLLVCLTLFSMNTWFNSGYFYFI